MGVKKAAAVAVAERFIARSIVHPQRSEDADPRGEL